MTYRPVVGNKDTSSWSLRPWLAMTHAGVPFEEVNIDLRDKDAKAQILVHSPSGKVPAPCHNRRGGLGQLGHSRISR
jgi:glutathione S-transferase